MTELSDYLKSASGIARQAGRLIKDHLSSKKDVRYKGATDLVTEADLKSQEVIASELARLFPEHGILAEENLRRNIEAEHLWIVDPLDGTTNFAHGYPVFAVSIALEVRGEVGLGVVYDPNLDELFAAEKGRGASLNGKPIRVSKTAELWQAMLATGFPYWTRERPDKLFDRFRAFSLKAQAVRRAGSAALDLCALACGRFDGFWEEGLKAWDTAAAKVVVEEAGGTLSKFDGTAFDIRVPEVLASNGLIHSQMLAVLP